MHLVRSSVLYIMSLSAFLPASVVVEAHGYLKSPRSRNWVAQEDGVSSGGPANSGKPEQDFCPHCLNSKMANNLCSQGNAATLYDHWRDINGYPMPWDSQGIYDEGGLMEVEAVLTTNHAGHMDMYICPDGDSSTQECLWDNPLTMVRDELYGGPTDSNYPERAYFANSESNFKFTYKLPEGVCGENILVQWRYITANSCFPPGYKNTAVGQRLLELGWLRASGMGNCQYPYDPTGATGAGKPEQFWNCAEITIKCSNPTVSPAPTPPPQPTPQPKPTSSPTKAPVTVPGFGYCNYGSTHDSSREKCDGMIEGGDWCNENQSQCEGPCNGNWCTTGGPTPATYSPTASSTLVSTTSPSKIPTAQPTTGCSEDPSDEFFLQYKNNDPSNPAIKSCEWLAASDPGKIDRLCKKKTASHGAYGPPGDVCKATCGKCPTSSPTKAKTSSPTKSPTTSPTASPTAQPTAGCSEDPSDEFFLQYKNNDPSNPAIKSCEWLAASGPDKIDRLCEKKTASHGAYGPPGDVCKATCGKCPTSSPTKAKTSSPTKSPTEPVTGAPNKAPTKAPTDSPTAAGDRCCSQFFDVCKPNPWCQESESNCIVCNGVILSNLPKQCIPRYGMCTEDENGCCYPSTCTSGNSGTSKQCMYSP